jgi:DNA replication and repair protein RecF
MNHIAPETCLQPDVKSHLAWIRHLVLTRFRNYEHLELSLDARPVVLIGPNGAGKTNILEAISLLAPGRGLRRARREQLVKTGHGQDHHPHPHPHHDNWLWAISSDVMTEFGQFKVGTGEEASDEMGRRAIRIDGVSASQTALAERMAVSWLTPDMDAVLAAAPSDRRRFLDRLVVAFDPAHAGRLSRYDRAMRQRKRLLEDQAEEGWISAIEQEMAGTGVAIIAARLAMVHALDLEASTPMAGFPAARLALLGEAEDWLAHMPAVDVEDRIMATARQSRQAGQTTMPGPHNSVLEVRHSRTGNTAEASSTGEQKALVISVVLAHARMQNQRLDRPPILLLDDIASHLDAERRQALFDLTSELPGQVWFSGTDHVSFSPISREATMIRLDHGRIL